MHLKLSNAGIDAGSGMIVRYSTVLDRLHAETCIIQQIGMVMPMEMPMEMQMERKGKWKGNSLVRVACGA